MVPSRRVSTCRSLPDSRHGKACWSQATNFPHSTTTFIWSPDIRTPPQCLGTRRTPSTPAIPLRMPPSHVLSVPPASMALCTRLVPTAIDSIVHSLLFPANSSLSMLTHILVPHIVETCIVTYSPTSPQGESTRCILKIDPLRNLSTNSQFSLPSIRPGRISMRTSTVSFASTPNATTALRLSS